MIELNKGIRESEIPALLAPIMDTAPAQQQQDPILGKRAKNIKVQTKLVSKFIIFPLETFYINCGKTLINPNVQTTCTKVNNGKVNFFFFKRVE